MVLDETERSLHDALCVIRCLVKQQALIAGGGAPEIEVSRQLMKEANKLSGVEQFVYKEFAQALEVIPTTLAENAGLNPINVVTDLRNRHENGEKMLVFLLEDLAPQTLMMNMYCNQYW